MSRNNRIRFGSAIAPVLLIVAGVLLNVLMERGLKPLHLPVYMDTFGTVIAALLGGSLPGVLTALITAIVRGATMSWMNIYFGIVGILLAISVAWLKNRGVFKKAWKTAIAVVFLALLSGVLSAVLTWFTYRYTTGEGVTAIYSAKVEALGISDKTFTNLFIACLFVDLIDKAVILSAAILIYRLLPDKIKARFTDPLISNNYHGADARVKHSLLKKVIAIVLAGTVLLGALACGITFYLYRETSIQKYSEICTGVTQNIALQIDADRVVEYIEDGADAPGYLETEDKMYKIRDSFPEIEYVYCYRMEKRGCRVVFDLDTPDEKGADPGDLIPFDESFEEMLPTLFAGGEIDPIITNDTYGWLLTVYTPLRDSNGECVCYVCADITMASIMTDQVMFIAKMFSLFFAVAIIVMNIVLEVVKNGVIFPINAMAGTANQFAYDTESGRSTSLKRLQELNISTEDEINNLYDALKKMAEDSDNYIEEVEKQSELISAMQEEIILDFAEMVEARDKCTGDHIKKTSYYVRAIAEELKSEGKFPEIMCDEYISKLVRSAPLHDVGKIKISDLILNKPGRLTEEEFEIMKTHTTEGREILTKTSGVALSSGYLDEALDMAYSHHERWDGTGYPAHLKGDEIPLSARIMAVADVFDALVSQRSYKQPFTYTKAIEIIKEESGTHFDPTVVDAFLAVSESAYTAQVGAIS
ncbi:MAG: HD domain-containing protein [Clostridia bacterium]|nr:HD domain-containing protein [Clostridia bacterium]